jgi:hypothetical protein
MLSFLNSWMFSYSSVEDVILFHGANVIIFEGLDVIIFMVYHICYRFWSTGCYLFRVWYNFLGCYHLCYHWVLSFILCYHLMLSFLTVCKCYHFCVNIFYLAQDGCYHLCYHLMLSFFVIISPLFSFSWKRDTLRKIGWTYILLLSTGIVRTVHWHCTSTGIAGHYQSNSWLALVDWAMRMIV